jgi:hypothetical protein
MFAVLGTAKAVCEIPANHQLALVLAWPMMKAAMIRVAQPPIIWRSRLLGRFFHSPNITLQALDVTAMRPMKTGHPTLVPNRPRFAALTP